MTTVIVDIKDSKFPSIKIPVGTSIAWRNQDSKVHSAETVRNASFYFNAGPMLPAQTSPPVEFTQEGIFDYICRYHHGMTGSVEVISAGSIEIGFPHSGHGHHLKHYHGFVTGGRSADALYMTHTPILADSRHHFQIILKGSLVNPEDVEAYNKLRNSSYEDGKVDIFHDHLSLPDIGSGKITELSQASLVYQSNTGSDLVPGTKEDGVKVRIDKVIFFHQFELDKPYPDGLEYIVYGDQKDVFIDHVIDRAPGFHSVAKLKVVPAFWKNCSKDMERIIVPNKKIKELPPQTITRAAFVDNTFQLFWLPPAGVYRPTPQDPLKPRDSTQAKYNVKLDDGSDSTIEIGRFLHFDFKLLNYGVLILEETSLEDFKKD